MRAGLRHVPAHDFHRNVHVATPVLETSELGGERVESRVEGAAGAREEFEEQKGREDAVALRQMEGESVAAALLAPRDHLTAIHELGHVLEPDAGLDERHAECPGDPVDLEGRRERLRDPAGHAASAEDVEEIARVTRLARDLGVNLAGIEIILKMRRRMLDMQTQIENLTSYVRTEMGEVPDPVRRDRSEALVRAASSQLKPVDLF